MPMSICNSMNCYNQQMKCCFLADAFIKRKAGIDNRLTNAYLKSYSFTNSTLRFCAFPSLVLLSPTGTVSPLPSVSSEVASMPKSFTNEAFTASDLFLDNSRLVASAPSLSVWPMIFNLMLALVLIASATSFKTPLLSGLIVAALTANKVNGSGLLKTPLI